MRDLLHFLRLCAYGLIGVMLSAGAILAHAQTPVATSYSWQWPARSLVGNGFASFAAAKADACGQPWSALADPNSLGYPFTFISCDGVENSAGTSVVPYLFQATLSGQQVVNTFHNITIIRVTVCPAGQEEYTFAVGDFRCRPAFCSANVGKYTEVNLPLGTTAPGVLVGPEAPADICINGCVLNKHAGFRTGVTLGDTQHWVFNGEYRFTGIDCASQPGLGAVSAYTVPTVSPSSSGAGSGSGSGTGSGLGATDSANIQATAANTGDIAEQLESISEKFNAIFGPTWSDCTQAATCTGDTLQCANAVNLRTTACALAPSTLGTPVTAQEAVDALQGLKDTSPGSWWASASETVDANAIFNRPRWMTPTGCPAIPSFQVMGATFPVSLQPLCDYSDLIAALLIISASLVGYRIAFTG